jgi:hypothetical protein
MINLLSSNWPDTPYREYLGLSISGQPRYNEVKNIKALRLKGQYKVINSSDGDSTTCTIVYKTLIPLIPNSELDGRTIVECVKIYGLGLDCGYMIYVK